MGSPIVELFPSGEGEKGNLHPLSGTSVPEEDMPDPLRNRSTDTRTKDVRVTTRLSGRRLWLTLQERDGTLVGVVLHGHSAEDARLSDLLSVLGRTATGLLEQGGTADDLVNLWLGVSFVPRGPVDDETRGKRYFASSPVDWAAREIGARYCGRPELIGAE